MSRLKSLAVILVLSGILAAECALCLSAAGFGYRFFFKPIEQIPFDVAGWNAPMTGGPDSTFTGTRLRMVDDLLKRYDFHGWTVQQLKDLLGEPWAWPDDPRPFIRYDLRDGLNLLIFEMDEKGVVVNCYVYRDD
jgi:hypothetical protein